MDRDYANAPPGRINTKGPTPTIAEKLQSLDSTISRCKDNANVIESRVVGPRPLTGDLVERAPDSVGILEHLDVILSKASQLERTLETLLGSV